MRNPNFIKLLIVGGAIALFILTFNYYYKQRHFNPYLKEIHNAYQFGQNKETSIPNTVEKVIWKIEGNGVRIRVVSFLLLKYKGDDHSSTIEWNFHQIMWLILLKIRYDDDQFLALYLNTIPFENGIGFNDAAIYHFNKRPEELSVEEVITLLVIGKGPKRLSPKNNKERFQSVYNIHLSKYYDKDK